MRLIGRSSKDSLVPFGGKSALVLQKYKVTDLVEIEDDIVDVVSGQRARLHDARGFTDRGPVAKVLVQKKIRRKVACELEGVAVVGAVAVGDVADVRKPGEFSYSRQLVVVTLKSSKAPTNYFTPNILRKSWSRLVVSVVHLDALAFPVAAT